MRNIVLLFFLSFAMNAICQSAEVRPTETQKLENAFQQEEVSNMQLEAFEERGAQKLKDLAGYLEYVSDEAMNETFRQQAVQLALELFVNPKVSFKYYENGKIVDSTIEQYLRNLLEQKGTKAQYQFVNITKISEIEKEADGNFSWLVQFVAKEKKDNKTTTGVIVTMNVSLQKIIKKFGSDTKIIWEVLLGEMLKLEVAP